MRRKAKPLGVILYEGPSLIDLKPIVVIANMFKGKSDNEKVGNMIKTWILRSDIPPLKASETGEDYSVCGDCIHRKIRSCYVNLGTAPTVIYNTYKRGGYVKFESNMIELFRDREVRIGSYGDPTAAPFVLWHNICKVAKSFVGYTHNWKNCDQRFSRYIMASVETEKQLFEAQEWDWRTFRVRLENDDVLPIEFVCPASKEGGQKTNCSKCGACSGNSNKMKKSPTIIFHGVTWKMRYYMDYINGLQIKV
jgi:hypothetical protein